LIYRTLFYVNTYGSYKLSKTVRFFGPPCSFHIIFNRTYAGESEDFRIEPRYKTVIFPIHILLFIKFIPHVSQKQSHREFSFQDCKIPPQSKNIRENTRSWNNHSPSSSQQHFIQRTTLQTWTY